MSAGGFVVPEVAPEIVRAACHSALVRAGVPSSHAELQVDLLVDAELKGRSSHGLLRLPRIVERIENGVTSPTATGIHAWRGLFLSVDGERGLGPVVTMTALDALAKRLKRCGVGLAAINNNNHIGMLGFYAERLARRGFVLIGVSTSEALVHPWGGRRAMLGTNPITIGVPTADRPFVLDMATSLVSMGQIHDHANRRVPIPAGWALDADGRPTTDAEAAKRGAIAPFGDAKGYALGLALEVLVTSLTGAAIGRQVCGTLDSTKVCNKGDVFVLIDPAAAASTASLITAYLDEIRSSGGDRPVAVPGDRAEEERVRRLRAGVLVPDELWNRIASLASGAEYIQ